MKKALSLILTLALLFSIGIISVHADASAPDKLSPELQAVLDSPGTGDTVDIVVYFSENTLRINDMPDWDPSPDASFQPSHDASMRHAQYIADHNYEITRQIFEPCASCRKFIHPTTGKTYYTQVDFTLDGCCTARDIARGDLAAICASPLVGSVGLFRKTYSGKYDPNLAVMLNAVDPDDWIEVGVHRAGYFKSVDDMPSWPSTPSSPSEIGSTPALSLEERRARIDAARKEYAAYREEIGQAFYAEAFEGVEVRYLYQGGNQANVIVKAGDIETIASRDIVKDIEYAYNAIQEPAVDPPSPLEKADKKLIGSTALDCTELPVYIELNVDSKTISDMPSWPDYYKASRELGQYHQKVKPLYDAAVADLNAISPLSELRRICCDALTAGIENNIDVIRALAACGWVRSIRYFESDSEWVTDHSRYDNGNTRTRYRERLISQYDHLDPFAHCQSYQELEYHPYSRDDKPYSCDWALVEASYATFVAAAEYRQIVGGRLLYAPNTFQAPFAFDLGIYDAEQDRFFDLAEIDFDDYPGLYETWQRMDLGALTEKEQPGDADGDLNVTILDATRIQRVVAEIDSRNNIVATGADADGDGETTVLDATRIQRYKADLCALDGTPANEKPVECEVGSLLIKANTGSPRSIARARSIIMETLCDFEIEFIGMLASSEVSATFRVTFAEKSAENDQKAIEELEKNPDILLVKPYQGEFSRYEADGFEPGRVIVSGDWSDLLNDFEIESTRCLTPGSGRAVTLVIFKEKTKDIVWRALELLENSPKIEYADPDFYYYADV